MYVMHRIGEFRPTDYSNNQCKIIGHQKYQYHLICAFEEELDQQDFVIDHVKLDTTIQNCVLIGSCERMHLVIYKAIKKVCGKNLLGYKAIIYPEKSAKAWMIYTKVSKQSILNYLQ